MLPFLMEVEELREKINNKFDNIVIIDVRFQLKNKDAGRMAYVDGHIPGAIYLDLNKDLSGKVKKHGGSHPLPDIEEFCTKLGNIGIDSDTTVVIYDQSNDMFSARMWWLLHFVGHEKMYLLNGGFEKWEEKEYEISIDIPRLTKKTYRPNLREGETVSMSELQQKLKSDEVLLIDSRSRGRYLGKEEPLYAKAGHIPGAKNYFWKDVLTEDNSWKPFDELHQHFESLDKEKEIIVSCGSGVSACPNIIALKTLGFPNVKLYPGSYSDWISYEENEIETKEE